MLALPMPAGDTGGYAPELAVLEAVRSEARRHPYESRQYLGLRGGRFS